MGHRSSQLGSNKPMVSTPSLQVSRASNASPIVPRTTTQTKWYPNSLGPKRCQTPKERMVPNKPSSRQSFMMAQSTKKKWLAFHQNTLDKDHKKSVLKKIGQLPHKLCIIQDLHLNTKCTRCDHYFHYIQKTLDKNKK